jgi:hypothetical protein
METGTKIRNIKIGLKETCDEFCGRNFYVNE